MPELSDTELMVLAWPTAGQPTCDPLSYPVSPPPYHRTHLQLDWTDVRQEIEQLHQAIDQQQQHIERIRYQLPRGWYKRSNPTLDLEIRSLARPPLPSVELPQFRQLLAIWQSSSRKPSDPR